MSDDLLTCVPAPYEAQAEAPVGLAPRPSPLASCLWSGLKSACEWFFGAATLIVGLSVLAAIPLLQFMSLGYLLEACGRVASTGRLREGFIGVRQAARVGGMALGTWLVLLPL